MFFYKIGQGRFKYAFVEQLLNFWYFKNLKLKCDLPNSGHTFCQIKPANRRGANMMHLLPQEALIW
jgi:hypothetical protein